MAGALTGSFGWNTPTTYNSGDVFQVADYNNLVGDVALAYAKPFMLINQQSAVTPTASGYVLFQSGVTVGQTTNSPASGAGSITYNSVAGSALSAPITGLYRISCAVTLAAGTSTAVDANIQAVGQNGVTSAVTFSGSYAQGDTNQSTSTLSFIYPMQASGTSSPTRPTSWFFKINYSGSIGTLPAGSASNFITWASLEYLGSSGNI